MNVGVIGLGRMGFAIAKRLMQAGHTVIGYDSDKETRHKAYEAGMNVVEHISEVGVQARVTWIMVPAGKAVDDVLKELLPNLEAQDVIVDGGNSFYKDSMRRAQMLAATDICYLDCGTSGGMYGAEYGFCLMIGGHRAGYDKIEPLLEAIAAPQGCGYVGPSGTGHYVKMIHNGIEYALLQAYADGFQIIKEGTFKEEHINLQLLSSLWQHGSIIRSFILELMHNVLARDQELKNISGKIGGGQTGQWTVDEAHEHHLPASLIERALEIRKESQKTGGDYATKLVALLRHEFGGHEIERV